MPDVDMIPKESLVGDHASNGEAVNAAKEVKRQVLVLKSRLEEKPQQHVPAIIQPSRHGAICLTRHRNGEDGKTAELKRTGKLWSKPALEFAQRIHLRSVLAQEPRSELQPRGMIMWDMVPGQDPTLR